MAISLHFFLNLSMSPLLYCLLLPLFLPYSMVAGSDPASQINPIGFSQGFRNLWGSQHQSLDNQGSVTIWLDSSSGSGFKSIRSYQSGYFGASIKLQSGYTAGVITSFYLSNNEDFPGYHDEIDIEFLGTTNDKPYILQTNVYIRGSGDGNHLIGREMKYHLWFDPTQDYHNYGILWEQNEIIFFVDDIPIRKYPRKSDAIFPMRPMWVYGSVWDASSWATEDGKYKANYQYQPFVGRYKNFKLGGPSSLWQGLSQQQESSLAWAQAHFLVYNYCTDPSRDRSQYPEC